ncbi:heme NO-binding domain-containing protein [Sulfitobacter sp. LCG007]
MHGLVNKGIQRFVVDSYGQAQWAAVVQRADLQFANFEAMLVYDDSLTPKVLCAASEVLGRPYDEMMEDIGTYLVSHPNVGGLRRLLRFGGVDFVDFLRSLDDMPDWARLAVPDLELPSIELRQDGEDSFSLICRSSLRGFGHVIAGALRALADDYGALAYLEHTGGSGEVETISIRLLESGFASGRDFSLGGGTA